MRCSIQMRRTVCSLVVASMVGVGGCSAGAGSDLQAAGGQPLAPETMAVLNNPGTCFVALPSSLPGIAQWTLCANSNGRSVTARAVDANGTTRAEVAFVVNETNQGATMSNVAFAASPDLADWKLLTQTLARDLEGARAGTSSATQRDPSIRLQDGFMSMSCLSAVAGSAVAIGTDPSTWAGVVEVGSWIFGAGEVVTPACDGACLVAAIPTLTKSGIDLWRGCVASTPQPTCPAGTAPESPAANAGALVNSGGVLVCVRR